MTKTITLNINQDFIKKLADYLETNYLKKNKDISKIALVFEGKRPSLFLRKELSARMGKSYFPPASFSIDEFMHYTLSKNLSFSEISKMESWNLIYNIARDIVPDMLKDRESFSLFLPWAREIAKFIDELDFEEVSSNSLKNVEDSASIGYQIPESINASLKNIVALREAYHRELINKKSFSKGFVYLSAAKVIKEINFEEFDTILFCGFFYMQKTEQQVIKHLYNTGKAILFFQDQGEQLQFSQNSVLT